MDKVTNFIKKHKYRLVGALVIVLLTAGSLIVRNLMLDENAEVPIDEQDLFVEIAPVESILVQTSTDQILQFFDETLSVENLYASNLQCHLRFDNPYQHPLEMAQQCQPYNQNPLGGLSLLWARSQAFRNFGDLQNLDFLLEDTVSYLNAATGEGGSAASFRDSGGFVCAYMEGIWSNPTLSDEIRGNAVSICLASFQAQTKPDIDLDSAVLISDAEVETADGEITDELTGLTHADIFDFLANQREVIIPGLADAAQNDESFVEMLHTINDIYRQPLAVYTRRLVESAIQYSLTGDEDSRREAEYNLSIVLVKKRLLEAENNLTSADRCQLLIALGAYSNHMNPTENELALYVALRADQSIIGEIAENDLAALGICSLAASYANFNPDELTQRIMAAYETQEQRLSLDRTPFPFVGAVVNRSETGETWIIDTELNGQLLGGMMLR